MEQHRKQKHNDSQSVEEDTTWANDLVQCCRERDKIPFTAQPSGFWSLSSFTQSNLVSWEGESSLPCKAFMWRACEVHVVLSHLSQGTQPWPGYSSESLVELLQPVNTANVFRLLQHISICGLLEPQADMDGRAQLKSTWSPQYPVVPALRNPLAEMPCWPWCWCKRGPRFTSSL